MSIYTDKSNKIKKKKKQIIKKKIIPYFRDAFIIIIKTELYHIHKLKLTDIHLDIWILFD